MRPYQYRCNDYSLLTPPFKKWVINPLIEFVPWIIPANIITFISNGIVYVGLYMALHPEILGTATPLFVSLTFILYLIGDHLDGAQAKRTKTGSALGEFCDHYLDAFNNGLIIFTMITVFDIAHKPVVTALIIASYLAHMTVFYEQFKTGWLTFESVGSLEGVLLSAVLIALSAIPPVSDIFHHTVVKDYTVIELMLIASSIGAIITFFKTYKRTPDVTSHFWMFAVLAILTGTLATPHFTPFQIFVVLTLYCSLYIGRLMQGHLIDGVERTTDYITPLLLAMLYLPVYPFKEYQFALITVYLSLNILLLVYQSFSVLKVYWVWANPRH